MPPLSTETLHLGDGHSVDPKVGKSVANVIQPKRFDDGRYKFHLSLPCG